MERKNKLCVCVCTPLFVLSRVCVCSGTCICASAGARVWPLNCIFTMRLCAACWWDPFSLLHSFDGMGASTNTRLHSSLIPVPSVEIALKATFIWQALVTSLQSMATAAGVVDLFVSEPRTGKGLSGRQKTG